MPHHEFNVEGLESFAADALECLQGSASFAPRTLGTVAS